MTDTETETNKTTAKKATAATVPAGVKKPQDHQPKATDQPEVINVTVRGVDLQVDAAALDDFELLDDLNELEQNQNPGRFPSILRRLVGDQWKTVIEALRGPNGRVSVEDGVEFVGELLEAVSPNS